MKIWPVPTGYLRYVYYSPSGTTLEGKDSWGKYRAHETATYTSYRKVSFIIIKYHVFPWLAARGAAATTAAVCLVMFTSLCGVTIQTPRAEVMFDEVERQEQF